MVKKIGFILWNVLIKLQRIFMVITAIATVFLVFGPFALRQMGIPFIAYEEFLLPIAFWMYMLGCSHGSYEKSQITADIMSRILKGKPKMILQVLASITTFILGVLLAYWAWALVQWSLYTGATSSIYKIPIVWGQASILVGLGISSIYNFVYMIKDLRDAFIRPRLTGQQSEGGL